MKKTGALIIIPCLICWIACSNQHRHIVVSTFAGTGAMGLVNGEAIAASFSNPMGVTADNRGNIYVADSRNNLIRKIGVNGRVSTLAGNGATGSADGMADMASFFYPMGVTADRSGNVYVADTHNNLIRKISPNGMVSTLAGQRIYHTIPGRDTAVRFDNPAGIAVDSLGNVYVADWGNNLIRKINPEGKVSTIAGNGSRGAKDGTGAAANFYLPGGIALDNMGNIYVSDTYNNLIRKISPGGSVTTLAGGITPGRASGRGQAASFSHPFGITVDPAGNIYVADEGNNRIRKISPDGLVSVFAGSGARGSANGRDTLASFSRPYGVAVDNRGNLYVADYLNNLIRRIHY